MMTMMIHSHSTSAQRTTILVRAMTESKHGYLYADGQRLEADDDYAVYKYNNLLYVVNKTGKIQKSTSKKYQNMDRRAKRYVTVTKSGTVNKYFVDDEKNTNATTLPTDVIRTGEF